MRWCCRLLGLLLISVAALPTPAQEGRLEKARQAVRQNPQPSEEGEAEKKKRPASSTCDDDDSELGDFLGHLMFLGLWYGLGVERLLDSSEARVLYFPPHPYSDPLPGYLQHDPPRRRPAGWTGVPLKGWAIQAQIEDGYNFDGLNRLSGSLLAESAAGLGVHTGWHWYHEQVGSGGSDDLTLGDLSVTWRLPEHEKFLLRLHVGARFLQDRGGSESGPLFGLSSEIFPRKPWVLGVEADYSRLGDASVSHLRGTLGWNWQHLEFYTGYDYLNIGGIPLHGPLLGVRLRF